MPLSKSSRSKAGVSSAVKRNILFEGNPLPMWVYDVQSLRFLEVNESAERQYGYTRNEFLSLTLKDILQSQSAADTENISDGTSDPDKVWVHCKKDGTQIYVKMRENDVRFRGRDARYVVAEDITERLYLQGQLLQLAHHDGLTGLPNRILFEQRLKQAFLTAHERGHRAAILCLDLDRFKQVNDWYGHAIGDECLKQVGTLLTRRLRGMDTVARSGGEEFTIVLAEVESAAAAGIVAKALLQVLSVPVEIEGQKIILGASIGVAVYPDHGSDGAELWRSADAAMYLAKRAGGNRHMMVTTGVTTSTAAETAGVEAHMRSMLQDGGFRLHYQVQYYTDGRIRGVEALLRLPHPNLGYVNPGQFIPLAEDKGLIHPLGKWVIEEACRQLMLWNSERETPVCIAINVSPLQLMRSDFVEEVRQIIAASGIDPAWLEMEITERVVLNFEVIARHMEQLAQIGIRFAVDDFGTGYSSLQHLHRLPISTLKIDCSFIQQLSDTSRSFPIVKSIIAMGHSLQLQVIAEGVEQEEQMRILQEIECDCIQGFLLSRPSPPETIEALFTEQNDSQPAKHPMVLGGAVSIH